ncbi:MAG: alpha/beta fold hydrolase [Planctomycetota bacterium]
MSSISSFVTNLELRTSNPDGTVGAGLSHTQEGLFLLHVLELAAAGEPRGAITLVHGLGGHGALYRTAGETFAERGWAVALPDLRGHGQSEGERGHSWGLPEPVRDLESICDHLAYQLPDAPKVVVATGLGGLYALAYAVAHPHRLAALVLVSPLLAPRFDAPPKPAGLRAMFKKPQPTDATSTGVSADDLVADEAARAEWRADSLVHDVVTRHVAENLPVQARRVVERASELSMPTLVLHGADDRVGDPELSMKLASSNVEARLVEGRRADLLRESDAADRCAEINAWLDAKLPR